MLTRVGDEFAIDVRRELGSDVESRLGTALDGRHAESGGCSADAGDMLAHRLYVETDGPLKVTKDGVIGDVDGLAADRLHAARSSSPSPGS